MYSASNNERIASPKSRRFEPSQLRNTKPASKTPAILPSVLHRLAIPKPAASPRLFNHAVANAIVAG